MILVLLLCSSASAQETAADYSAVIEFAQEYGAGEAVQSLIEDTLSGGLNLSETISAWMKNALSGPLNAVMHHGMRMITPALLLAFIRALLPEDGNASAGAGFLLRMILLLEFSSLALAALQSAGNCLTRIGKFTDIITPALTALLSAMGMEGSAALVSPAAALAGNAAEGLFRNYGIPLCRIALCTAIAGNLSSEIDLNRFTGLMRKAVNWSSGLSITLFTALMALQGGMSESLDGVAVRTAKYAVDSAAPVIGSGVSDAWDGYVSGIMISKNALGISGIAALIFACAEPMLLCLSSLLLLNIIAAVLDLFAEKLTARAAEQIAGVCQMALSLCTGGFAIATILLGAAMAAGRCLLS